MAKIIYPWLAEMPSSWPAIVQFLESYIPLINTTMVRWKCLKGDSYKCNSGGGIGSNAFCIRDEHGDLVYVEAWKTDGYSALKAEVKGFKGALLHCLSHNLLLL
uniref:Putative ovule protein n=1 Tax=Solanum chacoense TaxID=4108 RepID=A0A0V0I3M9_SOLCH